MARWWNWAEEERVVWLVKRCVDARQLKQVHAHVVANGQSQNNFLIAKLVRSFTEVGTFEHARAIADAVNTPNVFVWTALIRGCSQLDKSCRDALLIYTRMNRCPEIKPLTFTMSSVIKACAQMAALVEGMQVHAHTLKHGFQFDARVQTTLVDLYSKCRREVEARRVFDGILRAGGGSDVQIWNTMIAGYAAAGDMETAQSLFDIMPERNSFTWVEMITGFAASGQMDCARRLFDIAAPADKNTVVYTAMITGYAKYGDVPSARSVFDEMIERDVASWNAMISVYAHADIADEALRLFRLMLSTKAEPNQATIATVVSSCARSGSPRLARWIQEFVDSRGSRLLNSHTVAALIDLHCKCGDLVRAYELFCGWKHKDLICYSSMIAGFGIHGRGNDAIKVFDQLRGEAGAGLKPDGICFISILTACSHASMVDEGRRYFEEMKDEYRIPPTADHYMCVVDMLGRAGYIEEAYRLIREEMGSGPHAGVWGALLSACRIYGNVEVGEAAAGQLMELEPENAGNYVLLSNIYARARRWDGVAAVRAEMRRRGMRKPPGCSWVENEMEGGRVTRFSTGAGGADICDDSLQLQMMLDVLGWELKAHGYLPVPATGELE